MNLMLKTSGFMWQICEDRPVSPICYICMLKTGESCCINLVDLQVWYDDIHASFIRIG